MGYSNYTSAALTGVGGLFKRKDIKLGKKCTGAEWEKSNIKCGVEDGHLSDTLYRCMKISNNILNSVWSRSLLFLQI